MIEIDDDNVKDMLDSMMQYDLQPFKIYNAGDYEHENLVLIVNEECSLYDYILFHIVRNEEDLPDYAKCHFLSFDDIELQPGDRVRIYTCHGEDTEEIGPKTGRHYNVVYWNLDAPIWTNDANEIGLMKRGNSMSVYLDPKRIKK